MQIGSYSWKLFHDSRNVKKHPKKHIYKTTKSNQAAKKKSQNEPAIKVKRRNLFSFENSSEQKRLINKVFLDKQ